MLLLLLLLLWLELSLQPPMPAVLPLFLRLGLSVRLPVLQSHRSLRTHWLLGVGATWLVTLTGGCLIQSRQQQRRTLPAVLPVRQPHLPLGLLLRELSCLTCTAAAAAAVHHAH
jgi:hypothetical protein